MASGATRIQAALAELVREQRTWAGETRDDHHGAAQEPFDRSGAGQDRAIRSDRPAVQPRGGG